VGFDPGARFEVVPLGGLLLFVSHRRLELGVVARSECISDFLGVVHDVLLHVVFDIFDLRQLTALWGADHSGVLLHHPEVLLDVLIVADFAQQRLESCDLCFTGRSLLLLQLLPRGLDPP